MSTTTPIGERLRRAREAAGLNQSSAARALSLDRANISYWEGEKRVPSLLQLDRLAEVYGTTTDYLLGITEDPAYNDEHEALYRHLSQDDDKARSVLRRWLRFLDTWADLLEEVEDSLPGRGLPPKLEWRTEKPVTDSRRAPRLALEVRDNYALGINAISDLTAFLDSIGVLVHHEKLGAESEISGVFYNHPRLGYCILVNADHRPGRQLFTLAHEFAHALFHYQERGLVSRARRRDAKEYFANAFASHFLVPSEALCKAVESLENKRVNSAYDVVWLQAHFRVSYAMILLRLASEGYLGDEQFRTYKGYKPVALAHRLGINIEDLQDRAPNPQELRAYPRSVIDKVVRFIDEDILSPQSAASLLAVPLEVILELLATPEPAERVDTVEFLELPEPAKVKRARAARAA